MRLLIDGLKGVGAFVLLAVMLLSWGSDPAVAGWFTSPGGGTGGFTGRPLITVEITADKTSVPVNLAGLGPNPSLPYTSTITAVVKQDGRLLPGNIQLDLAPNLAQGALFNPADLTQGFRSLPLQDSSGISTAFFHASATPGTVTVTASAQDPNTGQTVSSSVKITVVPEERRAISMSFTGPYVNAVIAGESRFGTPAIQNGAYSRVISVVVADADGRPTNPYTQINFFLIDGPLTGYPAIPGEFVIAGANGDPVEGQFQFSAASGDFLNRGARPSDWLVLTGQPRKVERVLNATTLLVQQQSAPFNLGPNAGAVFPYVVGHAENGAILSPSFTDLNGVASTTLTYPVTRVGQTAILMACTADYSNCGILNTCDTQGKNCKSVYLGVTNGTDRTLTVSAASLGPNRSTDVRMCLRDPNFTPLSATEIRYDIGSVGPAKVTVNDKGGNKGAFLTGADGCTVVKIASSGQIPGSLPIEIQFTSDYVAAPVPITIKAPGAGKMDGLFNCAFEFDKGTGTCSGTLRLTDDEGSPMAGVLIALGSVSAAGPFELTFDPADGVFGKTNEEGRTQVTVAMDGPGAYTFPFQTAAGGTASYTLSATVPAPGTLGVTFTGGDGQVGVTYSAVLTADGGIPPYTWTLTAGSLPPGLGLGEDGSISGTPTQAGTFSFAVQATDTKKRTGFSAVTIVVSASTPLPTLTVTLNGPAAGALNVPYSAVAGATGGTAPYSFSLLAGSLPPGVGLSGNGSITGTPTQAGTFAFAVQATDSKGATGTGNFTITINSAAALTVTLNGPISGSVGVPYNGVLVATGGTGPYTWTTTPLAGNLPDGLSISAQGALSGTPTRVGSFFFTVEVTDSKGVKGSSTLTLTINSAQAPTITGVLGNGTVGQTYNGLLRASGGTALPYTWTLMPVSTLPPGLVATVSGDQNNTWLLAGTPTTPGTYTFTVRLTDANGATAFTTQTVTINAATTPQITTVSPLPNAAPNNFYATIFNATGGVLPYTWSVELPSSPQPCGGLPSGITLNATTGILSGTATITACSTYTFVVRVTGADGAFALQTFALTVGGGSGPPVANIQLLADPSTLATSGQTPVTLTAIARDTSNVVVKGTTVSFSANNNGTLQVTQAVTDDAGRATAILTSPNDKSVRTITVTANASGAPSATINVNVVGTTIAASGPDSAVIGNVVPVTFTLRDSAGVGIPGQTLTVISDPAGNTIFPPNPTTDSAGQATVNVTANLTGNIVASALGATGAKALSVATDKFVFTTPDQNASPVDVCVNNTNCTPPRSAPPQNLTVRLTTGNPPVGVEGNTVTFDTTRGTLSVLSAVTDANGNATLTIGSADAGPALITAKTVDTASQPIQTQVSVNFVATTPTQMTLQANPATISVNVPPSVDQKSTITATVRDEAFNLVKGVTVTFTLTDVTGGSINPASVVTDQFGQASTVYTAGSASSALNGVKVDAAVVGFTVNTSVNLTVAQRSLFITLGTGNSIVEPNPTTYEYPYSVLVTDTAGLPVPNALVTLNVVPVAASTGLNAYFKGYYTLSPPPPGSAPWVQVVTASCQNEDVDQNGIYQVPPDNDENNNGALEPGNVATVSVNNLTTNASGFAFFNVVYAQEYANWVQVELSARASVAGSEATEITRFVLPILASELTNKDVSPPGNPSPFGTAATCADPN